MSDDERSNVHRLALYRALADLKRTAKGGDERATTAAVLRMLDELAAEYPGYEEPAEVKALREQVEREKGAE